MQNLNSVLLIDDDPVSNFIVTHLLKSLGFQGELVIAKNGLHGIELLRSNDREKARLPDLIILDNNMPVMTGLEFLAQLKVEKLNINFSNIIIISNSLRQLDIQEFNKLGAERLLIKPLNLSTVRDCFEEMNYLN